MRAAARVSVAVPFCAALAWAAFGALAVVQSDSLLRQARTEMSTWSVPPARSTSATVLTYLNEASHVRPSEPILHELRGRLALASSSVEDARVAEKAFIVAIDFRPVSAHSWASLAEARYRQGKPGVGLEYAFEQAALLGPSEPRVQQLVADLGLATWRELTPKGQGIVDRSLATGIRRNPLEMLRISERRGRLDLACRHVVGSATAMKQAGRYCQQWEITP